MAADGLTAVTIDGDDPRVCAAHWIDATDPDDAELSAAARRLGLSDTGVSWIRDANQATRVGVVDGALSFVLDVPDGSPIRCAITKDDMLTVHDEADESLVTDAACSERRRRLGDSAPAAILSVITELLDRYDRVVTGLGDRQQAHAVEVLGASDGRESTKEIIRGG